MAYFRCIRSGQIVEFTVPIDVETTRKQVSDYVEVDRKGLPLKEEDRHLFKNDSKDLIERNKAKLKDEIVVTAEA